MSEKFESDAPRSEDAARLPERRTFLKAALATALAGGAIAGTTSSAKAMTSHRAVSCDTQYDIDIAECNKKRSALRKSLCFSEAMASWVACRAIEAAEEAVEIVIEAVGDFASWARRNPELVLIGAIIIAAGVTYVISTGGTGAPVLVALASA